MESLPNVGLKDRSTDQLNANGHPNMVPTIGRGTSLVKPHWRPNDAVKFPITLLLGAFPAN